ncbi:MAG TPA: hypothetical protein DEG69_01615, partial [Flavobacteriaceae bacterium]|nr:hypothetical protein [Flavobacteriaceae bacterium]
SKNVSSFLTKLDKLNDKKIDVFVPSLKKKIPTTPLNLKQQKDLISSMLDGIKGTLDFSRTLNKIIIENTGLTDLKIYDKLPFIVTLRKHALGNKAGSVELQSVINNFKNIPFKIKDNVTVKNENIQLVLKVPTLREEGILLAKCEQEIDTDQEVLKEGVGKLYIYEIIKYIDSIQIEDDVLELSDVRINERIKLVEKLPLSMYKQISTFIESVNKYNSDVLTVDETEISIDAEFFDTSTDD